MENLKNRIYQLIENQQGHASGSTLMTFNDSSNPNVAIYSGPNVKMGHAIVNNGHMLYHALDTDGNLSAGQARVTIFHTMNSSSEMVLQWRWLTGTGSSGVSKWRQVIK